tara:strand:- start:2906 stop:3244 length:339 start_codon:yes stop_codon:yes gene_type:complete
MLILMRKVGEKLVIGDDLKVELIEVNMNSVRLGVYEVDEFSKPVFVNREVSQVLELFDDVTIHVLQINGRQVKLGIDAPRSISVHREEIYKKILAERSEPITLSKRGLAMLG